MNDHVNNLTFEELCQTINNHFESKTNFLFVVDLDLACDICDYIEENHDLVAEDEELETSIEEYYVSVYFGDNDDIKMYVESARGNSGKYKITDDSNDYIDYFIGTTMTENEADKYLLGDGIWSWFKVVGEDTDVEEDDSKPDDCATCEDRYECDDYIERQKQESEEEELCFCDECTEEREQALFDEVFSLMFSGDACRNCIIEKVIDIAYDFKKLGYLEARDEMREFLDS